MAFIAFLCFGFICVGFSSSLVLDTRNQTYSGLTSYEFQNLFDLLLDEKQSRHQLEAQMSALEQKWDNSKTELDRQIELCEHRLNSSKDALEKLGNTSESEMNTLRQAFNKEKTNRHYLQQAFTRLVNDFQNLTTVNKELLARNKLLEEGFQILRNQTVSHLDATDAVIKDMNQSLSSAITNLQTKPMVAFTARSKNDYVNGALTFHSLVTAVGSGYNVSSGVFTCHVPGLYVVSMTLQVEQDGYIACDFFKNGVNTYVEVDTYGKRQQPFTQTAVFHLKASDTIKLSRCYHPELMGEESSFTIVLVQADN